MGGVEISLYYYFVIGILLSFIVIPTFVDDADASCVLPHCYAFGRNSGIGMIGVEGLQFNTETTDMYIRHDSMCERMGAVTTEWVYFDVQGKWIEVGLTEGGFNNFGAGEECKPYQFAYHARSMGVDDQGRSLYKEFVVPDGRLDVGNDRFQEIIKKDDGRWHVYSSHDESSKGWSMASHDFGTSKVFSIDVGIEGTISATKQYSSIPNTKFTDIKVFKSDQWQPWATPAIKQDDTKDGYIAKTCNTKDIVAGTVTELNCDVIPVRNQMPFVTNAHQTISIADGNPVTFTISATDTDYDYLSFTPTQIPPQDGGALAYAKPGGFSPVKTDERIPTDEVNIATIKYTPSASDTSTQQMFRYQISDGRPGHTVQGVVIFDRSPAPTSPATLYDDFESDLSLWVQSGDTNWAVQMPSYRPVPEHDSSNKVLHASDCDSECIITLASPVDLSKHSSAKLSFWRMADGSIDEKDGEYVKVQVSANGGSTWNTIYTWDERKSGELDGQWRFEEYDLENYLDSDNFKVRFVELANSRSEDVEFDDVKIGPPDTTRPVITLLGSNPQQVDVNTSYMEYRATATDNVDGDITSKITVDSSAVDTSTVGRYIVTYSVSDSAENTSTAQRTVEIVDRILPQITAPPDKTFEATALQTPLTSADYGTATVTDNYDDPSNITITNDAPDLFSLGKTTITWTATDSSGNTATATQTITINDMPQTDGTIKSYTKITRQTVGIDDGFAIGFGAGDMFGYKIANVGDLDGNGAQDMATIAFEANNKFGNVYLVLLNTDSTIKESHNLSNCGSSNDTGNGDRSFGEAIDYLGKINGKPTILVSNPWENKISAISIDMSDYSYFCSDIVIPGANGLGWPMSVAHTLVDETNISPLVVGADNPADTGSDLYVLNLDADASYNFNTEHQILDDSKIHLLDSNWDKRYFENSVIAEIDGDDSTFEIVLGEPRAFTPFGETIEFNGSLHVAFVDKQTLSITNVTTTNFVNLGIGLEQAGKNSHFGIGLANMGDLDGDNIDDIAVGVEGLDIGNTNSGGVTILFLNTDGTAKHISLVSNDSFDSTVLQKNDLFGKGLAAIDVNGDGFPELAASAHQDNTGGSNAGAIYLLSFKHDDALDAQSHNQRLTPVIFETLDNYYNQISSTLVKFVHAENIPEFGKPLEFASTVTNYDDVWTVQTINFKVISPDAPTNLQAIPGNGSVTVSWDAPQNKNVTPITKYYVIVGDEHRWMPELYRQTSETRITIDNLENGKKWYFGVYAVNNEGRTYSGYSVSEVPNFSEIQYDVPSPPTNIQAIPGNGSVTVSWDVPDNDGGTPITHYLLAIAYDGQWHPEKYIYTQQTVFTIEGLENEKEYSFMVYAYNEYGRTSSLWGVSATPNDK